MKSKLYADETVNQAKSQLLIYNNWTVAALCITNNNKTGIELNIDKTTINHEI